MINPLSANSSFRKPLPAESAPARSGGEVRSYDGRDNNPVHPEWNNQVGATFLRRTPFQKIEDRPNPREVSNLVLAQAEDRPDPVHWSGLLWGWGQFVDHDLTDNAKVKNQTEKIPVPVGDPWFDPGSTGQAYIPFSSTHRPERPWNKNSGWLDASMVYGSNAKRAGALRTHQGGRLLTGEGDNLPFNTMGLPNDNDVHAPPESLTVAGDVRSSENPVLLALHTVFMREHNRWAEELARKHPDWDDEKLYQAARKRVGALVQAITYEEYLPNLLGPQRVPAYRGYQPEVDARLNLEFVSAAFRLGHSQLGSTIFRNELNADMLAQGDVKLREVYFQPAKTLAEGGIAPVLRGAADYVQQATDLEMVDEVRNFLFGPPGAGGLDLGAINIARGREQGLPDFNTLRQSYGLPAYQSFEELTGETEKADKLRQLYGSLDKLDAWVGLLAEPNADGAAVGETVAAIVADQFARLRDGDRFYYENDPELADECELFKATTLSRLIARNLGEDFQPYAFHGKSLERD
ncbi:MAG: peroxidase [Candidatus Eremiobacteraeota bacterium]|nr:peroxidase [Candidatus Eremiobacteraeota bacterium]MCW5871022.1 peroxidase [Candidatus Eremiobacteraeota bacterium]